ncbi:MAG: glycosyltransferase [Victivallaceae bacterium]|nr:glycosyltransferase [Victivallaceae bacterium]
MNLIFVTEKFPFPQETFIESEIDLLSKNFKKVLIVPLNLSSNCDSKKFFPLPNNVSYFLPPSIKTISFIPIFMLSVCKFLLSSFGIIRIFILARIPLKHFMRLFKQYIFLDSRALLLCRNIKLDNYDAIYSYWGNHFGVFVNGISMYAKQNNFKIIARLHGYDLYAERAGYKHLPFQNILLKICNKVYPCSIMGKSYLQNEYPQYSNKISYAHLGVKVQKIINQESTDGLFRIVSCSRVVSEKRIELIVAALFKVKRNTVWTHIGDGPEIEYILQICKKLPENISIIFKGNLSNDKVLEYYRDNPVDLFINVSSSEGIPVSIMEAMSFGIPTIATDVGGTSELVNEQTGLLIEKSFKLTTLAEILDNFFPKLKRSQIANYQKQFFSQENYQTLHSEIKNLT